MITYPCLAYVSVPLQMWDSVQVLFLIFSFFFNHSFNVALEEYFIFPALWEFFILCVSSLCTSITGNLANTHLPALWVVWSTFLLTKCFPWHLFPYSRSLIDGWAFMMSHCLPYILAPFVSVSVDRVTLVLLWVLSGCWLRVCHLNVWESYKCL